MLLVTLLLLYTLFFCSISFCRCCWFVAAGTPSFVALVFVGATGNFVAAVFSFVTLVFVGVAGNFVAAGTPSFVALVFVGATGIPSFVALVFVVLLAPGLLKH